MSFLIKIDVKKNIADMDSQTKQAAEKAVTEISDLTIQTLQSNAPVKTGFLRSSFQKILFGLTARIFSIASYVMIVEKGSRPHVILPKSARVLHFVIGGQDVFAKSVQHPGTRGTFFIQRTRDRVSNEAPRIMAKHLQKVGKV